MKSIRSRTDIKPKKKRLRIKKSLEKIKYILVLLLEIVLRNLKVLKKNL